MKELAAILHYLTQSDDPRGSVLATLVEVEGSSYRRPGARLLVTAEGLRIGSISGGCLEEDVLAQASAVATDSKPRLLTYDTTSENDLVWGVGLGCHGVVQVLLEKLPARPTWALGLAKNLHASESTELAVVWRGPEQPGTASLPSPTDQVHLGTYPTQQLPIAARPAHVFRQVVAPPTSLVIFGAGDDAQPLSRLAKELGWRVTIADPRAAFATRLRFPEADALVVRPAHELVSRSAIGPGSLAVVMTHHYVHDLPVLRDLLPRPLVYLGLLGPRKRAEKILGDLTEGGLIIAPEWRDRLHAPVGLDLGADAPEEVALAIIAEMQAALGGRDARPLRERKGPIHA